MFECSRGCGASVTPRFSERGWGGSERDFIGPHRCPSPGLGWAGQPILLGVCVPNSCTSLVIYTRSKLQDFIRNELCNQGLTVALIRNGGCVQGQPWTKEDERK